MRLVALRLVCSAIFLVTPAAAQDDESNVLADGQSVPAGFVSLKASGPAGAEGAQLELVFDDPSTDALVRYTTARGSMADVNPSEHLHYGVYPIDVCIRDAKSGETLLAPRTFGGITLLERCRPPADDRSEDFERSRQAAIKGLQALEGVRFRDEYEPERKYLVREVSPQR